MPKTSNLLLVLALIAACATPKDDPPEQAPESIGPPLASLEGGRPPCGGGYYLYREERQLQLQCFAWGGQFVYENRGTLTVEAAMKLDAELAAVDLNDTEPVNWMGSCGGHDSPLTETLWIGEQNITFEQFCLIRGIVPLYEHVHAIVSELDQCNSIGLELFESREPGCDGLF